MHGQGKLHLNGILSPSLNTMLWQSVANWVYNRQRRHNIDEMTTSNIICIFLHCLILNWLVCLNFHWNHYIHISLLNVNASYALFINETKGNSSELLWSFITEKLPYKLMFAKCLSFSFMIGVQSGKIHYNNYGRMEAKEMFNQLFTSNA